MTAFVPLQNPAEVVSILASISIFGAANEAQLAKIFRWLEIGTCRAGEFIFRKGDEPSHIYIIKRGAVELFIPDHEHMIPKKRLVLGECFGQVAVLSIHKHTVSAVATEDSEFIVLSRHALHQIRHQDVELFALLIMNIARELARRLQYMDELLVESTHPRDRVMRPVAIVAH